MYTVNEARDKCQSKSGIIPQRMTWMTLTSKTQRKEAKLEALIRRSLIVIPPLFPEKTRCWMPAKLPVGVAVVSSDDDEEVSPSDKSLTAWQSIKSCGRHPVQNDEEQRTKGGGRIDCFVGAANAPLRFLRRGGEVLFPVGTKEACTRRASAEGGMTNNKAMATGTTKRCFEASRIIMTTESHCPSERCNTKMTGKNFRERSVPRRATPVQNFFRLPTH